MRKKYIRFIDLLAFILFIASFTPLVIPKGEMTPFLKGIPYTFWVGFIVSVTFVVLAYLASTANKKEEDVN